MDNVRAFLAELGERHGLALDLDEAGACTLPLADDRFLQVQLREGIGELDLVATLGPVPDAVRGPVFQALLAANYYWRETLGATLSWHQALEQVVLSYPIALAATDAAEAETAFGNFLSLQAEWARRLRGDVAEAEALLRAEGREAPDARLFGAV